MELSVITDEISEDLVHALDVCEELGVRSIELRSVHGANVAEHAPGSLEEIARHVDDRGMRVCAVASPFLKCSVRESNGRGGAMHNAQPRGRDEQPAVLERAITAATVVGAPIVRAFSFWREADPSAVRADIVRELRGAATAAADAGLKLGLENEHECNVATSAEAAAVLAQLPSPALGLIWDPANAAKLTPQAFAQDGLGGFADVRPWVIHVHLKDVDADGNWVRIGDGVVDHAALLHELGGGGYAGCLSIEAHYRDGGSGAAATRDCVLALRAIAARAGVVLEPAA